MSRTLSQKRSRNIATLCPACWSWPPCPPCRGSRALRLHGRRHLGAASQPARDVRDARDPCSSPLPSTDRRRPLDDHIPLVVAGPTTWLAERVSPSKADLEAARGRTIPDVLGPDLDVVFVGINPGLWSGAVGHHFARPGNRFWKALHGSGFTDRLLSPFEDASLLERNLGLTNLVARTTARADELSADEIRAWGGRARGAARAAPSAVRRRPRDRRVPDRVRPTRRGARAAGATIWADLDSGSFRTPAA